MITGTGPIATLEEAGKCLGVSIGTIRYAADCDHIRTARVNNRLRVVAREWLEDYCRNYRPECVPDWEATSWLEYTGSLMGLTEVAEYLGISRSRVDNALSYGLLRSIRLTNVHSITKKEWAEAYRPKDLSSVLHSNNSSGYRGVYVKGGRWKAHIRKGSKLYHLGTFNTGEEANQAYLDAKRRLTEGNNA